MRLRLLLYVYLLWKATLAPHSTRRTTHEQRPSTAMSVYFSSVRFVVFQLNKRNTRRGSWPGPTPPPQQTHASAYKSHEAAGCAMAPKSKTESFSSACVLLACTRLAERPVGPGEAEMVVSGTSSRYAATASVWPFTAEGRVLHHEELAGALQP